MKRQGRVGINLGLEGEKETVWPEAYATAKLIYPIPLWNARQ